MKSHFKNDCREFNYLINNNIDLNPILEIYRSKLFFNIQNFFINYQIKNFGYKSFQKKKNFSRTLTGIFSSWIFVQFSRSDCIDDCLIPSGNIETESLSITLFNMIQDVNDDQDKILQKTKKIEETLKILDLNKFCNEAIKLLNKYKTSKYYFEKKNEYNITKTININDKNNTEFYRFTIKLPFILNINLYNIVNNLYIPKNLYDKMVLKIYNNNLYKNLNLSKIDEIIWIILLRYKILSSDNHQLSLTDNIFNKLNKKYNFNFELFASSLNFNSDFYCSIFSDVEKYFGSYGSFYNLELIEGYYTFNPPFENRLMEKALNNILRDLDIAKINKKELVILMTIPIWDLETIKNIDNKVPIINYEEYKIIKLIKDSQYMVGVTPYSRKKFTYVDKLNNNYKNKTLSNTYLAILGVNINDNNILDKVNELFENKTKIDIIYDK